MSLFGWPPRRFLITAPTANHIQRRTSLAPAHDIDLRRLPVFYLRDPGHPQEISSRGVGVPISFTADIERAGVPQGCMG